LVLEDSGSSLSALALSDAADVFIGETNVFLVEPFVELALGKVVGYATFDSSNGANDVIINAPRVRVSDTDFGTPDYTQITPNPVYSDYIKDVEEWHISRDLMTSETYHFPRNTRSFSMGWSGSLATDEDEIGYAGVLHIMREDNFSFNDLNAASAFLDHVLVDSAYNDKKGIVILDHVNVNNGRFIYYLEGDSTDGISASELHPIAWEDKGDDGIFANSLTAYNATVPLPLTGGTLTIEVF
jgi:hypothetical protein